MQLQPVEIINTTKDNMKPKVRSFLSPLVVVVLGSSLLFLATDATLNLDPHAVSKQIQDQRDRVFVDVKFVEALPYYRGMKLLPSGELRREVQRTDQKICSSVDGPQCFQDQMLGVIPPSLVRNVERPGGRTAGDEQQQHVSDVDLNTLHQITSLTGAEKLPIGTREAYPPSLPPATTSSRSSAGAVDNNMNALDQHVGAADQDQVDQDYASTSSSTSSSVSSSKYGLVSANSMALDRRVPRENSYGLPEGITSRWEGKWVVTEDVNGQKGAELSSTTGYIRFSKPVIVRSLVVQCGKYISLVGGRNGDLQTVWMRAMRNQESFQHPIVVDLTDDSRQNIGLQTITELFFLTAEHVKLISLEVVEAAGTTVNVLLLGQQSELVRQSIDAAATAHVLSLADLIRKKLVIKTRQAQPGDLEDEVIVELITDMLTQPTAKGEDVAAMLNSGMVPDRLRTQIQKHDLLTSMDHLLVDFAPAAADASPEKKQKQRELAESLSRYNDLMMSAWLHWIQGMANRVGGPAGMIVHNNDYNPVGGSKTNKKSGVHGGRGGPMREVVLPSFFTNPVEERLWTELYTKAKQKVDLREQGQELVGEENSPQLLTDEFAAELDKMLNKTRKAKMRKKEKLRSAASKSSRASSKKMQKDEQSSSISSRDDVESTDRKEAKPGRKEIVREDVDDEDKSSGDLLSDAMESTGTTRRVVNEGRSDGAPGSEESATELGETSRGGVHSAPSARTSTSRTTSSSTADVETGAASGMASEDEESSHSASDDDRLGGGEDESSKGIEMKQPLSAEQEALRDRVREVIEQVENESADLTESTELVVDFLLTEVPEDQQDFVLQVIRSEAPGESPEDVVVEVAGSAEGNENDLKKFIQALSGAPDEDEVDGAAEDHGKKGTEAEEAERDATGDWRMRRLLRRLAHDHEDEL